MSGIQPGRGESPQRVIVTSESSGTAVIQSKTVVNLASSATDSHTYTAVTTSFRPSSVWATASGLIKIEIFLNGVSKYVGFNSTQTPNIYVEFTEDGDVAATQVFRVDVTNRELVAQNVYSTISGEQLPAV